MPLAQCLKAIRIAAPLACVGAIFAGAGTAQAAEAGGVVSHDVAQSPSEVREYWTPERMAAADFLDGPVSPGAGSVDAPAQTSAIPPDQETNPALDTLFPQRIHGALFFFLDGPKGCSATVVTSRSRNLILTAGHCVAIPGELSGGRGIVWASNVLFVPAYRNTATPFGVFPATGVGAPAGWAQGGDISVDVGAATLVPGPAGEIQDQLGARGVAFNRPDRSYRNDAFEVYGYPGKPEPDYDGERLIVCFSLFQGFESFSGSPVIAPCNQQEGSSGGGWVRNGRVESLVSHAGCEVVTGCQLISGTYFGEAAFQLYSGSGGGIAKGKRKRLKRCKRFRPAKRFRCRGRVQRFAADPR